MLHIDVLRSFKQGIACAKAGDIAAEEVYNSAINFAANDYGVRVSYVEQIVAEHFATVGYPEAW